MLVQPMRSYDLQGHMRREREYFPGEELELLYIAKRLSEALRLEEFLTASDVDYVVETGTYLGGLVFRSERVGAFFYVPPSALEKTSELLNANGWHPLEPAANEKKPGTGQAPG